MADVSKPERLLALIEILQSGRQFNARQLSEYCHVTRRTIFRDLATLQAAGIHPLYDPVRQSYSLPKQTFLPPTGFSVDEVQALLVVCQHEAGRTGLPFQVAAHAAVTKLVNMLPASLRREVAPVSQSISVRLGPHNLLENAHGWYALVVQSLQTRMSLRISYGSLSERKVISTRLSPYELFFSRRSWYVMGRSSLHRAVRTFNLGRIQQATLLEEAYVLPPRFSLDRNLGLAWHIIRGQPRVKVSIRFGPLVATNVAEVRWHSTERHLWNPDGSLTYTVTVDGLDEILWWILGYGDQAEVLEPAALRALLTAHAARMAEKNHTLP